MSDIKVVIECFTYNHGPYVRQCLDGFVSQKTNFKFVAIVHDDASTDNTADIIREYAERYPDIIIPIIELENQYSKRNGSLCRIMDEAVALYNPEYVAICEGDDYWIDPLKLQKQFDFMEAHPNHSMCFHAIRRQYDGQNRPFDDIHRYSSDVEVVPVKDIIIPRPGGPGTASFFYREKMRLPMPEWALKAPVGDRPLKLVLMVRGSLGYIDDVMSVYRVCSVGSWSESIQRDMKKYKASRLKLVEMMNGFDAWTDYMYHDYVKIINKKTLNSVRKTLFLNNHIVKSIKKLFK